MTYLGIDIGTSGVKTVLMDEDQRVVASETAALEVCRPHPGQSEQDAESWVAATLATVDALKANHPNEIAAVRPAALLSMPTKWRRAEPGRSETSVTTAMPRRAA